MKKRRHRKPRTFMIDAYVYKNAKRTTKKREKTFVREFLDTVDEACQSAGLSVWHRRIHGSMYGVGLPDVVLIIDGRTFWLEFKRANGRLSGVQKSVLQGIREAGGTGYAVIATGNKVIEVLPPPDFKTPVAVLRKESGIWVGVRELFGISKPVTIDFGGAD